MHAGYSTFVLFALFFFSTMARYTLYTANTPNGQKVPIMMEEAGLDYELKYIDLMKKEQHDAAYVQLNPNGKIPTLVDNEEGITVFESGAILLYLAERHDAFLPEDMTARFNVLQWLFFQMGGVGPMFGQLMHFKKFAPVEVDYAIRRYDEEAHRLLGVIEKQLSTRKFIAGLYSIADMALWPWIHGLTTKLEMDISKYPKTAAWHKSIAARAAVKKAMASLEEPAKA